MPTRKLESLATAFEASSSVQPTLADLGAAPSNQQMTKWFETVLAIQQSALGESDFYEKAAQAVCELIGLDDGMVVLGPANDWRVVAHASLRESSSDDLDHTLLNKVLDEQATFFESLIEVGESKNRSEGRACVAAPIFNNAYSVVGVLFGARRINHQDTVKGVKRLEALVVQMLAGVVSSGLIREDRQAEASRFQMQLEQFASPSLIQAMAHDPKIFEPREREISVLFSDIHGFTSLTERVGAEKTFSMISNLMNQLTGCILDEDGFIMSYLGDGIAAMWNAPTDQPDHAELATWAAINMQKVMSKLSQFWSFVTGEVLEARIGIATGKAHVGNAGSRWRLNYSALGPCVNFASRLEGANKYLGTQVLISGATRDRVFSTLNLRRIGPVSVKGMDQAQQVYEVILDEEKFESGYVEEYEAALELFEQRRFEDAQKAAVELIERCSEIDSAVQVLLAGIEKQLQQNTGEDPIIRLSRK